MTSFHRRLSFLASALVAPLVAGSARAQQPTQIEGTFNVQSFSPGAGPRNYLVTRGARTDGEHGFSAGMVTTYARRPFVVASTSEDIGEIPVVENLLTVGLLGSYTPIPQLQIGLHAPLVFSQGQGLSENGTAAGDPVKSYGVSDPELEVKYRLTSDVNAPFVPAIAAFATAPLGDAVTPDAYVGRDGVSAGARGILDLQSGPFGVALNLGYRYQSASRVGGSEIGSHALVSLAAGYALSPVVRLVVDGFGSTQFSGEPGTNPLEIDAGAQITPLNSSWAVQLGAGAGLTQGAVGVPDVRGILGVSYTSEEKDVDGDGIPDKQDQCPTEPEDKDGYEDADGCAELDNDNDALADAVDKCPNEAEDLDKFEDSDGCPEPDNDRDGIPDVQDRCPDEAETVNGYQDEDGCPDVPDTDGDGVKDSDDKCPNEPEDTDGFQDTDGCPDLDNDGDGIPDDRDECVDEAETINGEDDEDGCPEEEEDDE